MWGRGAEIAVWPARIDCARERVDGDVRSVGFVFAFVLEEMEVEALGIELLGLRRSLFICIYSKLETRHQ